MKDKGTDEKVTDEEITDEESQMKMENRIKFI
jgi:hypothetical protein